MVNIFGAGSNQIVIYCDAINDFTYGFFPITITNVFTREQKTFNPEVIVKNTRYIKLCFNLVSSQPQEDLSIGKIYIKTQGTFEFQVGNSSTFNTNVSLMNPYRIVETIEAQVELREQEVQYTSFISENEDLEAYVFVDDDPCPDGNCPPTDCYTPSVGERYGGGLVYEVDTQNRIAYIAGQTDVDGLYDWGVFGSEISGLSITNGKIDTEKNLLQNGKKGQAADIITGRLIDGYSDWYLPSLQQYTNARTILGTSLTASNRLYWTSRQGEQIGLGGGVLNEIYNSTLFFNDDTTWQDVGRDASFFSAMGVFTGAVDSSNTIDDYPYEIRDIDGRLSNEMFWLGVDGDAAVQQIGSASFVLEANTFYTYRAYFKATGTVGEIRVDFVAQNFNLTTSPSVTLKFGNDVIVISSQACEYTLTDVGDGWFRLEMTMATLTSPTANVSVSQVVKASGSNPDFYWYYSSPTFRKGYFNRHAPFVAPNTTPERIDRTYNLGYENPIEGTFSVGIGARIYDVDDSSYQDINLAYFTPYTHSNSLTLHAKNLGCRYIKISTNNNAPYDMENPFAIVDLDTGNIVKETTSSMNWVFNNFNVNDTRWVKSRTFFTKEYKKDIWGEYSSWLIGSTQSDTGILRFYYDLLQRTSDEDLTISFYTQPQDNQQVGCFVMNTSETVIGQVRYNPQTKNFTNILTTNYVISATASPNVMGDWDKVIIRVRIPAGQSTLRFNINPFPGPGRINICGVQIESGTISTDTIFTNGNTIFYRNDGFSKWNIPNGGITFSFTSTTPEDGIATRLNFPATYSVLETPSLTGLSHGLDYVFSTYVRAGTSGAQTPNFSLEMDNMPAGSSQQGSSFTWVNVNGIFTPTTTSTFAGVRNIGSGWFQVWHRVKLAASGTITNIQAEFRATPSTPGNFFAWNPLVELGLTPSVLPRVYRRPGYNQITPLSKNWVRMDYGYFPIRNLYNMLDNRMTFTPMKSISGASASTSDYVEVWGAQATPEAQWFNIYPIENFAHRTFIPQAWQQGRPDGFYTAFAYNPVVNRTGFYRKDLYFKIKPFRQQNY